MTSQAKTVYFTNIFFWLRVHMVNVGRDSAEGKASDTASMFPSQVTLFERSGVRAPAPPATRCGLGQATTPLSSPGAEAVDGGETATSRR